MGARNIIGARLGVCLSCGGRWRPLAITGKPARCRTVPAVFRATFSLFLLSAWSFEGFRSTRRRGGPRSSAPGVVGFPLATWAGLVHLNALGLVERRGRLGRHLGAPGISPRTYHEPLQWKAVLSGIPNIVQQQQIKFRIATPR